MKAYQLTAQTGPDAVQLCELPDPSPGPGQVTVRVRATALNYRDLMIASGRYGGPVPLPLIPLSDGAGEIAAVGEGCRAGRRATAWPARSFRPGRPARFDSRRWRSAPSRASGP